MKNKNLMPLAPPDSRKIEARLAELKIRHQAAQQRLDEERVQYVQTQNLLTTYQKAHQILQDTAHALQQEAHHRIASVVSRCLELFDEPYTFDVRFEKKKHKTEAVLQFVREGVECDPLSAAGGGCVDVAAFALRLACLVLHKPALRPVVVLDEPFRFVSPHYLPRVKNLLETISQEMGVQIIMVTNIPALQAGKVVEL